MHFAPSSIGSEVEQLTTDPRFNGLNPATAKSCRAKVTNMLYDIFLQNKWAFYRYDYTVHKNALVGSQLKKQ